MSQKVIIISYIRRSISSNIVNYHNHPFKREGKFMRKMIYREIPRKKWHPAKDGKSTQFITPALANPTNPHVTRRVTVLNKLFMKHITDLMATGEISSRILGRGIEVSRINITNDFKLIKVFWFSSSCNADELNELANILHESAYKIRHELSQLRVIGVVPPIQFFEDKQLANAVELEKKLLIADYGDDFTPTMKILPQPKLTLVTSISDDIREKIVKLESDENTEGNDIYNVSLPPMKHDIFGLDHLKIISDVRQSFLKNDERVENHMNNSSSTTAQRPFISTRVETLRSDEEVDAFNAFLLSRRIEEKKRKKLSGKLLDDEFEIDRQPADIEDCYDQYKFEFNDMNDVNDDNDSIFPES